MRSQLQGSFFVWFHFHSSYYDLFHIHQSHSINLLFAWIQFLFFDEQIYLPIYQWNQYKSRSINEWTERWIDFSRLIDTTDINEIRLMDFYWLIFIDWLLWELIYILVLKLNRIWFTCTNVFNTKVYFCKLGHMTLLSKVLLLSNGLWWETILFVTTVEALISNNLRNSKKWS